MPVLAQDKATYIIHFPTVNKYIMLVMTKL